MAKATKTVEHYGIWWPTDTDQLEIELWFIRNGGVFTRLDGSKTGNGLFYHFKRFQELLWPEKIWHRWNELELKAYLENRIVAELGPASSGKTNSAATNVLTDYYAYPNCTTILVSSTEREMLEMRVWGEIKKFHRLAKSRHPDLPGELIESRQRIVTSSRQENAEGRDFRNGICGVPTKRSGNFQGLGSFVGIKNKRVRLIADEGHLMPRVYVDAISNLNKNKDFKCVVLGNPKETTDALGIVAEPSAELGGWDGGIDQQPGTKTWPTRFDQGICVQLVGSDSPNLDGSMPIPLINQKSIDADIKFYGKDSLQFTMMNEGRMPRGQGLRRVITRQMCLKFGAMEEFTWADTKRTDIAFLDAAYGSVGGDRCVFGRLSFGRDIKGQEILALIETLLVPVSVKKDEMPEDQVADFVKARCEENHIPPDHLFFDSTGRGSLMGAFARKWSPHVVGVEFGGRPTERPVSREIKTPCDEYYSKFVTELWFSVRLIVEAGQFRGMTEEVMQEGSMREWGFVAGNKIEVEPKDKMKEKTGRSPDLFDALAVGCEGARRLGFVIQGLANQSYRRRDDNWKRLLRERSQKLKEAHQLNYAA